MATFARWCYRHRIIVVVAWLVVLATVIGVDRTVGNAYSNTFNLPGTESAKALSLLSAALPKQSGDSDSLVWHVSSGSVNDPAVRTRITALLQIVAKSPSVAAVTSPYTPRGAVQISRDGKTAYATVLFTKLAAELRGRRPARHRPDEGGGQARPGGRDRRPGDRAGELHAAVQQRSHRSHRRRHHHPDRLRLAAGHGAAAHHGRRGAGHGDLLDQPALALGGIATMAPTLAALIGLGVGIDYSLFIVTRHRDGLKSGLSPEEAAVRALNTAGRAVLFAGGTVCIALLGLLVLRLGFLNGLSISSAMTVLIAMAAAVTLLPALFGFMGMRVLSRRERRRLDDHGAHEVHGSGFWVRWAGLVARRPLMLMLCAVAPGHPGDPLLLAAARPLRRRQRPRRHDHPQSLRPAGHRVRSGLQRTAHARGADRLERRPGGAAAPRRLPDHEPGRRRGRAVARQAGRQGRGHHVFPTTAPQDVKTSALITHLRTT